MRELTLHNTGLLRGMSFALLLLSVVMVAAQNTQSTQPVEVEGIISAREGDTMTLRTSESPNFKVVLTDETKVGQVQGVLQARRKDMSMAALIPGLKVKVKGTNNDQHEFVADSVNSRATTSSERRPYRLGCMKLKRRRSRTRQPLNNRTPQCSSTRSRSLQTK